MCTILPELRRLTGRNPHVISHRPYSSSCDIALIQQPSYLPDLTLNIAFLQFSLSSSVKFWTTDLIPSQYFIYLSSSKLLKFLCLCKLRPLSLKNNNENIKTWLYSEQKARNGLLVFCHGFTGNSSGLIAYTFRVSRKTASPYADLTFAARERAVAILPRLPLAA